MQCLMLINNSSSWKGLTHKLGLLQTYITHKHLIKHVKLQLLQKNPFLVHSACMFHPKVVTIITIQIVMLWILVYSPSHVTTALTIVTIITIIIITIVVRASKTCKIVVMMYGKRRQRAIIVAKRAILSLTVTVTRDSNKAHRHPLHDHMFNTRLTISHVTVKPIWQNKLHNSQLSWQLWRLIVTDQKTDRFTRIILDQF